MAIVRPTIVGCTWISPYMGWVDVPLAAGALFYAGALGAINRAPGRQDYIGDQIPVDFVCHAILRIGANLENWNFESQTPIVTPLGYRQTWPPNQNCKAFQAKVPIIQIASSNLHPITWGHTAETVYRVKIRKCVSVSRLLSISRLTPYRKSVHQHRD